jgi:hypothetical protein
VSEQHNPDGIGGSDENRYWNKKKKAEKPSLENFPIGKVFIGHFRDYKGLQSYYLLEVLDSYRSHSFSGWARKRVSEPKLFCKVKAVTLPIEAGLVNHLISVSLDTQSLFNNSGPFVTDFTEADTVRMGYPWASSPLK